MRALACLLALTCACATLKPTPPTVASVQRSEEKPLPPDPETEKLDGVSGADWVQALEKGSCITSEGGMVVGAGSPCPALNGIAMSESKAARFGLYKIRYVELRKTFEADRSVWRAHRELYETRLKLADQAIQNLQPSWWERNALSLGVVGGFVLGTILTISVVSLTN